MRRRVRTKKNKSKIYLQSASVKRNLLRRLLKRMLPLLRKTNVRNSLLPSVRSRKKRPVRIQRTPLMSNRSSRKKRTILTQR